MSARVHDAHQTTAKIKKKKKKLFIGRSYKLPEDDLYR